MSRQHDLVNALMVIGLIISIVAYAFYSSSATITGYVADGGNLITGMASEGSTQEGLQPPLPAELSDKDKEVKAAIEGLQSEGYGDITKKGENEPEST